MENPDYPLLPYKPPTWASELAVIPKYRVQLANLNTPIHRWHLPGTPEDFEVSIKRDDMTGSVLSGNKIRKLEFLLADALSQGCDTILTCGGVRSNHSRATAIASRQMGLEPHLIFRSNDKEQKFTFRGNTLLDRMVGCHFYLVPNETEFETGIYPRMDQLIEHLRTSRGRKPYKIPVGGSNAMGSFGYVHCFWELLDQGVQERFTDIVVATGSSGTVSGLAIGNHLTGGKLKIHGMAVSDNAKTFLAVTDQLLRDYGLQTSDGSSGVKGSDILDIVEGAKGLGYGVSQPDELEFFEEVATTTGILVDPVYTGKASYHLMKTMRDNPDQFQGKKILFIHTGGMFDLFNGKMEAMMESKSKSDNRVYDWMELTDKLPFTL